MSAQPSGHGDGHDVIHLGGEAAIVVPIDEYRRLKALERRASPDELEEAEADVIMTGYREWVAAGRPGEKSHEEFMAELLGDAR